MPRAEPLVETTARGPRDRPAVPPAPELTGGYRFVSAPDFLNQDVADLTADGRKHYVVEATGEVANSTNASYETALDRVLDEMAGHGTRDVLVAGDLVEGRWGRDDSRTGVFGPVRTQAQRLRAWRRAADVYYPAWLQRFDDHGLRTYPAVGDHEVGDDPWRVRGRHPWVDFKRRHVPEFKKIFADHALSGSDGRPRFADRPRRGPARHTAYAVRLDADVLLVTLDVFERRGGDVHMSVDAAQLAWLERVLRKARRDEVPWVMVQGHTPMPGPVRVRNSTHLVYEKGRSSKLWRTMVDGGVDVYLSGEVHDQTVRQRDGILEVSHGSLFYRGEASYVLGQATAGRLVLENHQFWARSATPTACGPRRARERRGRSPTRSRRSSPAPSSPAAPAPAGCGSRTPQACSRRDADPGPGPAPAPDPQGASARTRRTASSRSMRSSTRRTSQPVRSAIRSRR